MSRRVPPLNKHRPWTLYHNRKVDSKSQGKVNTCCDSLFQILIYLCYKKPTQTTTTSFVYALLRTKNVLSRWLNRYYVSLSDRAWYHLKTTTTRWSHLHRFQALVGAHRNEWRGVAFKSFLTLSSVWFTAELWVKACGVLCTNCAFLCSHNHVWRKELKELLCIVFLLRDCL